MGVSRRAVLAGAVAASATALAGCSNRTGSPAPSTTPDAPVVVASKPFAEQRILGYMAYESIRANTGLIAVDEIDAGTSLELWNGILAGEYGTYWEYTGTLWEHLPPIHDRSVGDPDRLYEAVRAEVEDAGAAYLNRAPFDNTWALAVRRSWAERTGVETISDLAAYANDGATDLAVAIGDDFQTRADGWSELVEFYGFDDVAETAARVRVVSIGLTYELLGEGEVDVAMAFGTDPQLRVMDLVVLADDRDFFVPYNPAPVVGEPTIEAHPELRGALDPIGPAIGGEETMRRLNGRAILNAENPRTIARDFLRSEGLV